MTEFQFVEWCILIGNDYTEGFSRKLFKGLEDDRGFEHKDIINEVDNDDDDENNDENSDDTDDIIDTNTIENQAIVNVKCKDTYSTAYLNYLRELIISQKIGFQLHSDNENLQSVIEFSRDLYNLNDLNGYEKDESDDEEGNQYTYLPYP